MHISARIKYHATLSADEQSTLLALIHKGTVKARTMTRARILLLSHEGKKDKEIPCFGYHVLVKTKTAKKFIKLFFAAKLTPSGRMWMMIQHHPTQPEASSLHPYV